MANFSWFIGVFLGATLYRWLARDEREVQATAAFHSGAVAQKDNPPHLPRRLAAAEQTGTNLAVYHYSQALEKAGSMMDYQTAVRGAF